MEATSQFRLAKVGNTCLELIADGDIDQEVTAGVDNEKPVVERRGTKEPNWGSEFCKRKIGLDLDSKVMVPLILLLEGYQHF